MGDYFKVRIKCDTEETAINVLDRIEQIAEEFIDDDKKDPDSEYRLLYGYGASTYRKENKVYFKTPESHMIMMKINVVFN